MNATNKELTQQMKKQALVTGFECPRYMRVYAALNHALNHFDPCAPSTLTVAQAWGTLTDDARNSFVDSMETVHGILPWNGDWELGEHNDPNGDLYQLMKRNDRNYQWMRGVEKCGRYWENQISTDSGGRA